MEEADRMIKDSSERLGNAVEDLKAIIVSFISACSTSWSFMFPAVVCQAHSRTGSRPSECREGVNGGRERPWCSHRISGGLECEDRCLLNRDGMRVNAQITKHLLTVYPIYAIVSPDSSFLACFSRVNASNIPFHASRSTRSS